MYKFSQKRHFWAWFLNHHKEFNAIYDRNDEDQDYWIEELGMHLHAYCKKLYFEIQPLKKGGGNCLIITAGMTKRYFTRADKLVAKAPAIEGWEIVSLIPPRPAEFLIEAGLPVSDIDLSRICFVADKINEKGRLPIQVYVETQLLPDDTRLRMVVHFMLSNMLGERSYCKDLGDWEIVTVSAADLEDKRMLPIQELPAYVASLKSKYEIGEDGELREREKNI